MQGIVPLFYALLWAHDSLPDASESAGDLLDV